MATFDEVPVVPAVRGIDAYLDKVKAIQTELGTRNIYRAKGGPWSGKLILLRGTTSATIRQGDWHGYYKTQSGFALWRSK